jgi:hypothetical protein
MISEVNNVEVNQSRMGTLQKNSAAAGATPSAMIGRMIDDKFGGHSVGKQGGASVKELQKHVDGLERILKATK